METVVILNQDQMGHGDEALGRRLVRSYLETLASLGTPPRAIVFYNTAVRLLGPESPVLESLRSLEEEGTDLLACVTCLDHFQLMETMAVGTRSNMREIVTLTQKADKVITL